MTLNHPIRRLNPRNVRRSLLFLLSGFFLITQIGAAPAFGRSKPKPPTKSELDLAINQDQLSNGIKVISYVDNSLPTVSLQIFVDAGSRDEVLTNKTGLAHIFEHLMFRGTPRFPDYDDALLSTGAENNADTDLDRTRYFEDIKAEHLDRVIEVEADRFKHLNFNRTAFNNELGPVRQEREKGIDNNPGGYLGEQLQDLAFTVHTYKHDTIGTKEDIIHMQYDDAYNFYNTFYNPKSIFIVVVGNFDRPKTVAKLDKEFSGDWGRKPFAGYAQPPTMEPPQEGPRRALLNWKDSLTPPMLSQGYHAPSFSLQNNDFCALELTEKLLFLESSPLSVRLIQKLALVQPGGFEGGVKRAKDPFLYYINATLRQGKSVKDLSTVEHEIEKELQRLRVNPVSARDLEKAKNNYVADILFSLKSAGSIARSIGELYVLTKDPQTLNQLIGCYRSVHANDVKRVVNTYLVPKNRNTVALLPKGVQ